MKEYYAYIYFDPSREWNGGPEPIYVGKGHGRRMRQHLGRRDVHPFTHRLKKMITEGIEPLIHKIVCSTESIAYDLERGLIKTIGRKDQDVGPLLNLTDGGEGTGGFTYTHTNALGYKHTEENRKQLATNLDKYRSVTTKNAKGRLWVTNGIICKRVKPDNIPQGFWVGRPASLWKNKPETR